VLATNLFGESHGEYFGNFSSSLFTMLQIATGDAWYSVIAREVRWNAGKDVISVISRELMLVSIGGWCVLIGFQAS